MTGTLVQRSNLGRMSVLFLVLSLYFTEGSGQTALNDWGTVERVKVNSLMEVKTRAGVRAKGKLLSVTANSISIIDSSGKRTDVNKDEVVEARTKSRRRTAAFAAIFAGVGLAVGYVIGFGIGEAIKAEGPTEFPGAAVGVIGGAIGGALLGNKGKVIYKAP